MVTKAYKATLAAVIKTKAYILSLDMHLDARLAAFRRRHKNIGIKVLVSKTCAIIRRKLFWRKFHNMFTKDKKWIK